MSIVITNTGNHTWSVFTLRAQKMHESSIHLCVVSCRKLLRKISRCQRTCEGKKFLKLNKETYSNKLIRPESEPARNEGQHPVEIQSFPETSNKLKTRFWSEAVKHYIFIRTVLYLPEDRMTAKIRLTNLCLCRIHRYTAPDHPTWQAKMLHLSDVSCLIHLIIPAGQDARFGADRKVRWKNDTDRLTWN